MNQFDFLVVIEPAGDGQHFCAYAPDVPGCIAVGDSFEDAQNKMSIALQVHLNALEDIRRETPPEERENLPEAKSAAVRVLVSA